MADWVVCPSCGLRQSRRPDGVCPKCKASVDQEVPSPSAGPPPTAGGRLPDVYDGTVPPRLTPAEPKDDAAAAPLGSRVAGAVMVLNAAALFAEKGLGVGGGDASPGSSAGVLFGLVIGIGLVAGNSVALKIARWVVPLGGIAITIIQIAGGHTLLGALQGTYTAGLMGLLFGNPAKIRIVIAGLATAVTLSFEALGLLAFVTGSNPLARLMMANDVEPLTSTQVQGLKVPYRLGVPNTKWFLRKAANAQKDNPLADRWLVRPDQDAHVLVIAETLPGNARADMERFVAAVLKNTKDNSTSFEVLDQSDMPTRTQGARLIHVRHKVKGMDMESYFGLFIQDQYIFQVVAFANHRNFPSVGPELKEVVSSFQFP